MMKLDFYLHELKSNAAIFEKLLLPFDKDQIKWKQEAGKWNMLEIICHLYDEEREDFRARLKILLEQPGTAFPPIDPVAWVTERQYAHKNFNEMLNKFLEERNVSLEWLKSLKNPDWNNSYLHPKVGPITAKFMLANWVAHDYLHFRQITRLKYDYLKYLSNESLDYAGKW
jgi:hypothetical protein